MGDWTKNHWAVVNGEGSGWERIYHYDHHHKPWTERLLECDMPLPLFVSTLVRLEHTGSELCTNLQEDLWRDGFVERTVLSDMNAVSLSFAGVQRSFEAQSTLHVQEHTE